jgi:hypothetical protein
MRSSGSSSACRAGALSALHRQNNRQRRRSRPQELTEVVSDHKQQTKECGVDYRAPTTINVRDAQEGSEIEQQCRETRTGFLSTQQCVDERFVSRKGDPVECKRRHYKRTQCMQQHREPHTVALSVK